MPNNMALFWNIRMGHLQHLKNTNTTCVQWFANINEKQLHPEYERLQHVKNNIRNIRK
jgi:hypothetical protein